MKHLTVSSLAALRRAQLTAQEGRRQVILIQIVTSIFWARALLNELFHIVNPSAPTLIVLQNSRYFLWDILR